MCWSAPASYTIAAVGVVATVTAIRRKDSALLWTPLAYFTAMEALQGYSYSVEGQCALPQNQIATLLAYFHISFQPLMGCLLALYFIPDHVRRRLTPVLISLGAVAGAYMLLQIMPLEWAAQCRPGRILCSDILCVKRETWHIGWHMPLNNIGERVPAMVLGPNVHLQFPIYSIVMFLIPALVGSWKIVAYQLLIGPTLAWMTTSNPNEMPAIWCLFSLGIVMLVVFTPARDFMRVERWVFWPKAATA